MLSFGAASLWPEALSPALLRAIQSGPLTRKDLAHLNTNRMHGILHFYVCVCVCVPSSDGQRMSKRKKNYPDPGLIVKSFGADALR